LPQLNAALLRRILEILMLVFPLLVSVTERALVCFTFTLPNRSTQGLQLNLDEAGACLDESPSCCAREVRAKTSTNAMPDKSKIWRKRPNCMRRILKTSATQNQV
jgi:hypothetical protein